ncbi:MAG TPA: phosphotransferase [Baekduia sp.]|uniref:phosphotransferase n=1 Tax=Baekduia sp. TaxID=2600305 RepID=UPI002CCA7B05|nr:phosphotransferase [Baekduia sp.]HMJ37321.1 phosphotransferase [Baekduia sp.]
MAAVTAASRFESTTRRLAEHVRTPVYREGYALVLSAGVAAILGFAYWIVAARTYSADVVGLNSAAISMMMLVSGVAQLNLIGALVRFVPGAGRSTWRLVGWSYAISVVAATLVSVAFLAGVRKWAPSLASLSSDHGFAFWFVAATTVWCIFNLQDAVLTGLRRAIWVPVDNVLFGVAKIGLLVAFATMLPRLGIFASWTFGVVLSVLMINGLLAFRLIPEHTRRAPIERIELPSARSIGRFVAADYVGGLSWIVAITLIPIIVTQRFGAAENAYYSLAWVMTMPLYLLSASTASSLVVALVNERWRFREYTHRVFVQTARLVIPAALLLAVAAPLFLRLFGPEYAHRGTTALRLMAFSAIPAMVIALYMGVWRAEKRLSLLVWVRCVLYTAVVLLSVALLHPYGIRGPAFAWLVVQTIAAAVLFAVWPQVLLTNGSRIPWRLRSIRLARNAAADTGVLTVAGAIKRRPALHRRRTRAAVAVARILAELPENGAGPPPSAWTAHELPASVTDKLVVLAGPAGAPPRAVVKLAESQSAARGLVRETEVLSLLSGDSRLEAWRAVLPEVLAAGEIDGEPFRVEGVLPGVEASRLMAAAAGPVACLGGLAEGIEGFHRQTRCEVDVGPTIVGAWVDAPLAILGLHARRRGGGQRWQLRALDRLRDELHEALAGKRLTAGWTHGDYTPGNLLVDPATGTVSGIVDWEMGGTPNLQAIDLVQLVLATRALRRRREYGEMVTDALAGRWTEEERTVLARGTEPLRDAPTLSALVLLAWLRHTQNLLTKADGYADNWLWQRLNFEAPLAALA